MDKELEKAINRIQDGEDIGLVLIEYAESIHNENDSKHKLPMHDETIKGLDGLTIRKK